MSIFSRHGVACPQCQALTDGLLIRSLNPVRHPHLKELLLARQLHAFRCVGCEATFEVDSPLLYVDLERRQFVGMVPNAARQRGAEVAREFMQVWEETFVRGPAMVAAEAGDYLVRLAFGHEELREKIVIDDAGLSDLSVEALKAVILTSEPWFRDAGVVTLSLDAVEPETGELCFVPLWIDGPPDAAAIPALWVERASYDAVDADYDQLLERYPGVASGPHCSLVRLIESLPGADGQADPR
jgi:hypothetical protein